MRFLALIVLGIGLAMGGWYMWERFPRTRELIEETISQGELSTFKIRYTAESLMKAHLSTLMRDSKAQFLEPTLTYYPYLLMEIKFAKDESSTQEGSLLWGLIDGEMVLDTMTWEKTHGFEDCIASHANASDLKIIRTLVAAGGSIDRDQLYQLFKVESDVIDNWIESLRKKKLIVISAGKIRLHFQNPKLEITPMTRLDELLVKLTKRQLAKAKYRYHPEEIKEFAKELFGEDFVIRKVSEVFLPVYTFTVLNSDGTHFITRWNALNGKRLA